jgi:hypothetical protein
MVATVLWPTQGSTKAYSTIITGASCRMCAGSAAAGWASRWHRLCQGNACPAAASAADITAACPAGSLPFTITSEHHGRTVASHLVHITSPPDIRYHPLTEAAAKAPAATAIRALVVPLVDHSSADSSTGSHSKGWHRHLSTLHGSSSTEPLVHVTATWHCHWQASMPRLTGAVKMTASAAHPHVYEADVSEDRDLDR